MRFLGASFILLIASQLGAVDIVKSAKPAATIVIVKEPTQEELARYHAVADIDGEGPSKKKPPAKKKGPPPIASGPDAEAALLLVEWVEKMTGAKLAIAEEAPAEGTVIYLGIAAQKAGLAVDDIQSPTYEGLRLKLDGRKILIGGQRAEATFKGVCRFLEEFGCRVFMDGVIGEVYPKTDTLAIDKLDITAKPGFIYRRAAGPSWRSGIWKQWNGAGGTTTAHAHSWGGYVSKDLHAKHPEFFAMRKDGTRPFSDWLCTSNPELREHFANQVIARIKAGAIHPSISPADGTAFCQCEKCLAQDDPKAREPSSGVISMSARYVDFFDDIGRRVAKVYPKSILSFYCYSDYTQPPPGWNTRLSPNLSAFVAPIRYCRLHGIGCEICPQRVQQKEMIDGWSKIASKMGYYMYMYDLAEATVPFSILKRTAHDIPYLKKHGCVGINQEILTNWHIYGPTHYLSQRLMYDPDADADAIMEDYFAKFYGPKAAAPMKEYWYAIDDAIAKTPCHSGSFFWIPSVYTPEFLTSLGKKIDAATKAAEGDERYAERVALHAEGYKSAVEYRALWEAMNRGDFTQAKKIYDDFCARLDGIAKKGWANPEYASNYLRRFTGNTVNMGAKLLEAPNRLVSVLPNVWRHEYDPDNKGIEKNYQDPKFDDSGWKKVATYSATLSAQGFPDTTQVQWYRTQFEAPKEHQKLALFFGEVDGIAEVFINGKKVIPPTEELKVNPKKKDAPPAAKIEPTGFKRRVPFEADITALVTPGTNQITVRVDHTRISELNLGGILRPVYLIEKR